MARPPDAIAVHAVVVNYRTPDLAIACAESLLHTAPGVRVLLVDGGSADDSAARLAAWAARHEAVGCLPLADNRGFGAACNRGIEHVLAEDSAARFTLLVNPDAVVEPDCVQQLLRCAAAHPDAGVVGGKVLSADGQRVLFEQGRLRPFTLTGSHGTAPAGQDEFETEFVTGALMLLDAELLRQGLRFDEGYFLYVEDLALCRAVRARGRTLWLNLRAVIRHVDGASQAAEGATGLGMRPSQLYYLTRNKIRFARSYLPAWQRWVFYLVATLVKPGVGTLCGGGLGFLRVYARGLWDGFAGREGPR